jgi:hypothetical protein
MKRYYSASNIFIACACGVLAGCSPDASAHYSTAHLEIETTFGEPLCQGDLDRWEDFIDVVELELDVQLQPGLNIYLWDVFDWPIGKWCSRGAVGCYVSSRDTIYSTIEPLDHELVHAIAERLGSKHAFFDEGIAVALEGESTRFGDSRPSDNIGLSSQEVDRTTAGHFVRWLIETGESGNLRKLLSSKSTVSFGDVFGSSIEDIEQEFFNEAPWSYPPFFTHDVPELPSLGNHRWGEDVSLSCDRGDVYGRPEGVAAIRTLTIIDSGSYVVWTDADGVLFSKRQKEIIWDDGDFIDQSMGDVPLGMAHWINGSEVQVVNFAPGEYELWISNYAGEDAAYAQISISPFLGQTPQRG